jgi:hypothetical protein
MQKEYNIGDQKHESCLKDNAVSLEMNLGI